jgi:hypothetical protein
MAFSSQARSAKRRSLVGTGTAPSGLAPARRAVVLPAATSDPAANRLTAPSVATG